MVCGVAVAGYDLATDVEAIDLGEVEVEAHQVVFVDGYSVERRRSVGGDVDGVAVAAQAGGDGRGEIVLVLDNEDAHQQTPSGAGRNRPEAGAMNVM